MDANGTRFHLLLGKDDWARCLGAGLSWDDRRYEVTLEPQRFRFVAAPQDIPPRLEDRRGAARDRYGNWYWIDSTETEIVVNSSGTQATSHFWSAGDGVACERPLGAGDFQPLEPAPKPARLQLRGLAVTEDHYLVTGVLDPPGLLIFDLHAGGPPRQLLWPAGIEFSPFDMAPKPGGGVWILDRDVNNSPAPPPPARLWVLDRHFNVIRRDQQEVTLIEEQEHDFQPTDGSPVRRSFPQTFSTGISLEDSSPVAELDAISIEALPDCTVLILDRMGDVHRYYFGEPRELVLRFGSVAHDFAFVPGRVEDRPEFRGTMYVVGTDGNQTFAFDVLEREGLLETKSLLAYFPMRLFGGKGLVTAGDLVYYDFDEIWIPLTEQRRPRYAVEAELIAPTFDGVEPDCVWHRLMLDACIPSNTEVEIWTRASNDERDFDVLEWNLEPEPYLRGDGPELPFAPKRQAASDGTWELLFQRARGRYLQIRMRVSGDGRTTPRLRALRVYYPRFSYLDRYLPAVFREDAESASFLDRFLANLEGFYTPIEDKIAATQMLFDVQSAPADALEWLAGWFGVTLDPAWDERKRRLFIRHAMEFFQFRGTIRGLTMALRLALEECAAEDIFEPRSPGEVRRSGIRIVERYLTRRTPGVVFGDPTELETGPRIVAATAVWVPEAGRDDLNRRYKQPFSIRNSADENPDEWKTFAQNTLGFVPSVVAAERKRWQKFLSTTYPNITSGGSLPGDLPSDADQLKAWTAFVQAAPSAENAERRMWQAFLARRYQNISTLNERYKTHWTSFEMVSLPDEVPEDGAPLLDWFQFEAVVLPVRRTAHHFTVMLPMPTGEVPYSDEHQRRLNLAERLVNLEKPAHTTFDLKFYWAMFRVGGARLGDDTVLDYGSRAPQLRRPLILGRGHLAESYLEPAHPLNVMDRMVAGRDQLKGGFA